jgi:alanine racemase
MHHTSYLEISKSAYKKNIDYLRSEVGQDVQLSAVVKGNAYGHGIENIVKIAENASIRHFSTFSTDEAIRVYNSSTSNSQIMIMGMLENEELEGIILKEIEFFVFEFDRLIVAAAIAKKIGVKARIHVELETGFHRTGFEWKDRVQLKEVLLGNKNYLEFKGICTHYAGAESISNLSRIQNQLENFTRYREFLWAEGLQFEKSHTACSAAALLYPETIMNMVRIGIATYGFWPTQETYVQKFPSLAIGNKNPLKRLISWKSSVMSLKEVKQGNFIGYGSGYLAPRNMQIALIPIGYAHGYSRNLSNLGKVLIREHFVSVVGTVTMNSIAVDVTDLNTVNKGDEVVIIGKQGQNEITVASFSESTQQVNYELLTRLPQNIPRIIVD